MNVTSLLLTINKYKKRKDYGERATSNKEDNFNYTKTETWIFKENDDNQSEEGREIPEKIDEVTNKALKDWKYFDKK